MSELISLTARPRTVKGKQVAQLRRAGVTPIVVYGRSVEAVALQTDSKDLWAALSAAGTSRLIALHVEGEPRPRMTLVRDVQRHVTKLNITHADLLEVAMDELVRSEVRIELAGEPTLVQHHEAILEHSLTHLTVEALPANLPSSIIVDCAVLDQVGDAITVADLVTAGKYEVLNEAETAIVRLLPMSRGLEVREEEPAVAEEPGEPEVITQRRASDEDAPEED